VEPAEFEASFETDHDESASADLAQSHPPVGLVDNRVAALIAQLALALNPTLYVAVFCAGVVDAVVASVTGAPWGPTQLLLGAADRLELALRFATAVAFITWLYRASKNMYLLAAEAPENGPANAIVAWFVPCANFYWPYLVVGEIDRKSDPTSTGRTSGLVGAWWGAWVATLLLLQVVSSLQGGAAAAAWMTLMLAQITAATLAILVIRRIQRNQIARATRSDAHAIAAQFA
jgi:hypothetical protein